MIRRREEIEKFLSVTTFAGAELQPLAGDASARRYVRAIKNGKNAMIMDTPAEGENFPAFVAIAEHLKHEGYSAPEIFARDMEKGFLLLEDFGAGSFTSILKDHSKNEEELYSAAIDLLAEWHNKPTLNLPLYNDEVYMREVSLFPDWYLPKIMGAEKATKLRAEYMAIWEKILRSFPLAQNTFVHRDYHADNLMWLEGRVGAKRVGLLDFQDALLGDPAYDIVSLLEDARRDVPTALVEKMKIRYVKKTGVDAETFNTAYHMLGAQRNSKIIGIFVRLCVRDGKENYLNYLPRVWAHLENDIKHPMLLDLKHWLKENIASEFRGELAA
jgi:hypothetical protein